MPRNIPTNKLYSILRSKFKQNMAFQKGYLKRHDEELHRPKRKMRQTNLKI